MNNSVCTGVWTSLLGDSWEGAQHSYDPLSDLGQLYASAYILFINTSHSTVACAQCTEPQRRMYPIRGVPTHMFYRNGYLIYLEDKGSRRKGQIQPSINRDIDSKPLMLAARQSLLDLCLSLGLGEQSTCIDAAADKARHLRLFQTFVSQFLLWPPWCRLPSKVP